MVEISIIVPTWTVYILLVMLAVEIVLSIVKIYLTRKYKVTKKLSRHRYGD